MDSAQTHRPLDWKKTVETKLSKLPVNIFKRCVLDSNDAIMITDCSGILCFVNNSWSRIYGYTFDEAVGQSPRLLHSGEHDKAFYDKMWASIRDPKRGYWKGEVLNRCRNGRLVPVMLTITPYKSDSGAIEGYMGLAVDLTEQKRLERQMLHQDRLATLGILATGLAHEVGNPLGVIRGRAELMQMRHANVPAFVKELNVIVGQIDRISGVIETMLKFGRAEAVGQPQTIGVARLLEEIATLLEQKLQRRGIAFEFSINPQSLEVRSHPSVLQQVLLNVILNAMQAIEGRQREEHAEKGEERQHRILVVARQTGTDKEACFEIADSGGGVPEPLCERVFEPFFTTKVGEGTGLGLSIVEKLLGSIGGRVECLPLDPETGGARFTLCIPQAGES